MADSAKTRQRLFVIDGTALVYRSFFALQRNPLINSKGLDTSAIFGFTQALLRLIDAEQPNYLAVAFDSHEPTFRHAMYADYKATREKMPETMADQLPYIEKILRQMNIPILMQPTLEADDLIAALIKQLSNLPIDCYIVSADKDFMQLISPHVFLYASGKANEPAKVIAAEQVIEKFGVPPKQMVDLLTMIGDSSDNIPGLSGVGPKTAANLLKQYQSLDAIIAAAKSDKLENEKLTQQVLAATERLSLSRQLIALNKEVNLTWQPEELQMKTWNTTALAEIFRDLEFRTLEKKMLAEKMHQTHELSKQTEITSTAKAKFNYHLIANENELDQLIAQLQSAELYAFDCETTDLNFTKAKLVGIAFSITANEAWYVPLYDNPQWLAKIRELLAHPHAKKGGHNVKFDLLMLKAHDVIVENIAFDSMIESYLLHPSERAHNLDHLSLRYLNHQKISIKELIGDDKQPLTMDKVEVAKVAEYGCEDVDFTLKLHHTFSPELKRDGLDKLYQDVEIPLAVILFKMEFAGIRLDMPKLQETAQLLNQRMEILIKTIYEIAGEQFNINSPKQLATIIFEKLELQKDRLKRLKKTKSGFSTDISVLESLQPHPFIDAIIEYRNHMKLKTTYTDTLPEMVDSQGKIHTHFNQTVAATGRLSSSNPNLQNIPIRSEMGRNIRKAFIASTPQNSLLSADYSQIELRILAHLSQDPNMIQFFIEDRDIHTQTAARLFKVKAENLNPELRSRAKAINFGIIYGMGPQRLSKETGVNLAEAQKFIDTYFETFPKIASFIEQCKTAAKQHGYIATMLGRRRQVSEIHSSNPRLQAEAERIAVNTPIQGSAADLIKLAMIQLDQALTDHKLRSKLILQVHDELVLDVPIAELEITRQLTKAAMQNAYKLAVPLKVEIGHGNNWLAAHS